MSEKLTISSVEDLRTNLWIDEAIQFEVFRNPIDATREELDRLRQEISSLTESARKTEIINRFLRQKQETVDQTRTNVWELLRTWWIAWVVWWAMKSLQDTINEDDWTTWIERILWMWEKIAKWWDNLKLSFSTFMCAKFPRLAKWLWIENPIWDGAAQATQTAENLASQAKEQEEKIAERVKPWYNQFISIYFKIFRVSNEVDDDNINRSQEEWVSEIIFEQDYFKSIKYNDLNNPSHIDNLYNAIQPSIPSKAELANLSQEDIKKYIKIALLSISWWNHIIPHPTWRFWQSDKNEQIQRWNNFLVAMYKREKKNISEVNPSMFELFDKLHGIWDFEWILWDWAWMDLESIERWIRWKAQELLSHWMSNIAGISQIDFDKIKWWLSEKLQNLWDFKDITTSILKTRDSRTLWNNFQIPWLSDWFESNEALQTFIWNENEWLLKFWNDMYASFFASNNLLWTTWNIPKDQVSLKKVYEIYLITWGKTNLDELSPMQKVNLTANLLSSYGTAMDVWSSISDIIDKVTSADFKIDKDVKNILFSIGKYALNASIDAATTMWKVWWWLSTEHKIYSLWLLFILVKAPIFSKRTSLI